MCSLLIWYIHILWNDYHNRLVNTFITHIIAFFVMRTFKVYSLSLEVYNIISLTVVTILYVRFLEIIHIKAESLYSLTSISLFSNLPWLATIHYSTLFLSLAFCISHISDIYYLPFSIWLISLTRVLSRPYMLLQMAEFPSFLWLNNTILYPFIYSLTLRLFQFLGYCE